MLKKKLSPPQTVLLFSESITSFILIGAENIFTEKSVQSYPEILKQSPD